ncbi:MAG: CAP domain-containing protein [Acidobacteriota bacterium]|nr:CAP domain-containing protein [Acidobacteriota bacterium]
MNVARLAALFVCAAGAAGAALSASGEDGARSGAVRLASRQEGLRLRAPDLSRPISEKMPDPSRPADPVKAAVLRRINEDRGRSGLPPVAWDETASRAADGFCARQVEEKSRGHFLMDGIPPYGRMSFAGIFAMNAENSASWVTTGSRFSESIVSLALDAQESMMQERPPADGHRRTILDPRATHVGVGYFLNHGRFQMAQEFLTRRFEHITLAAAGRPSAGLTVSGKAVPGERIRFVTVAREPVPRALSREQASGRTSYSYPDPYLALVPEGQTLLRVVGMPTEDRLRVTPGREFSFFFVPDRPGLYTFSLYLLGGGGGDRPYPAAAATVWVE